MDELLSLAVRFVSVYDDACDSVISRTESSSVLPFFHSLSLLVHIS